MSKNIINTIGQHVFIYDPPKYTEEGAPVLAKNPEEENDEEHFQFLGEGYYFWDDNIKRAHRWGKTRCDGKYLIMELPMELKGDTFLDLVGSRADLMGFCSLYRKMCKKHPGLKIGAFFHGMQEMAKENPEAWPCTMVRALNVKSKAQKVSFNHVADSKMLLNPEIIICFYEKNELNLQSVRYIDKNNRIWTSKKS